MVTFAPRFPVCRLLLIASLASVSPAVPLLAATVTSNADSGPNSLRAAIAAAAPGETIDFAITGTILLTSGQLLINTDLTIAGPGAEDLTIDGNTARVFEIGAGATVTISGLTIANGASFGDIGSSGSDGGDGGAGTPGGQGGLGGLGGTGGGGTGGGIRNGGNLTVVEVAFRNNNVFGGIGGLAGAGGAGGAGIGDSTGGAGGDGGNGGTGNGGHGGAIWNNGSLTVLRSEFSGNGAFGGIGGPGGAGGDGGGVDAGGTGGVGATGGDGGLGESGRGSALFNAGTATVLDSTFDSNGSFAGIGGTGGDGGDGGDAPVQSGTGGTGGDGGDGGDSGGGSGAIDNVGTLTLIFVTSARNEVSDGIPGLPGAGGEAGTGSTPGSTGEPGSGGAVAPAGGANLAQSGTATVGLSILASPASGNNCSGAFTSAGYNVSFAAGDTSCDGSLTQTGDQPGADPILEPLNLNPPGSTRTDALGTGSAAIDVVPIGVCLAAANVDQRGVVRPQGDACDAGAFEVEQATLTIPTLGGWGLFLLLVALGAAGVMLLRRSSAPSKAERRS